MTETLPQIRARHAAEIRAAVQAQADSGVTQTTAARKLGASIAWLHNFRRQHQIIWQTKYTRETAQ